MQKTKVKQLIWTPELAKQFWADLADTAYLRDHAFARFASDFLIKLVQKHIDKGSPILDYGCGAYGFLVEALIAQGYKTAAYEPDRSLPLSKFGFANDPLYCGEIDGNTNKTFETVFFTEVIEHLFDQEMPVVLDHIYGLLSEGGRIIVTTPNNEDLAMSSVYCPISGNLFHPWQHVRSFTPESLTALLDNHGFERINLYQVDFSSNREPLEGYKILKQRQQNVKQRLMELIKNLLANKITAENNKSLAGELLSLNSMLDEINFSETKYDGQDLHIGAGSTIVYIGKKSRVNENIVEQNDVDKPVAQQESK
jgi:2-polyprenyl-3-methyl-5-hydroxy-6-metoxy-1,4-benzoquinol methylase